MNSVEHSVRRRIAVVTGSRAEYGLLYWVIKGLQDDAAFDLQLLVTGMHLVPDFGLTVQQIESDGLPIAARIDIELERDDDVGVARSFGLGVERFAGAFRQLQPDLLLVLGDRFEILAAVTAALFARLPVAHLHGGELSEGAYDDAIRHSITKMSHLHFVASAEYKRRVEQLGEAPDRIYNVGAVGLETLERMQLLDREAFEAQAGVELSGTAAAANFIVTFHPATLSPGAALSEMKELLAALSEPDFAGAAIVFTAPNADNEGRALIHAIETFVQERGRRTYFFRSMGQLRYLSYLQWASVMIGNSSSGLIEAPAFKLPTVNIGDRQKGRLKSQTVIDCDPNRASILAAIQRALSPEFKKVCEDAVNPYGGGNVSAKILGVLRRLDYKTFLKKEFNDLEHRGEHPDS